MTASKAKSGEAGDSPAPKEVPLPAGHAAGHDGIQVYTGDDRKFQSAGDFLEIPSGAYIDFPYPEIHYSKFAGLGPMIAAGVYLGTPPLSLDLIAISGRFSNHHSAALATDIALEAFRPPRTLRPSVVLQSPRDYRTIALFRNYMRQAKVFRPENLEAIIDKRINKRINKCEDSAEKKKLEAERLLLEEDKRKFEEEKRKFEEALFKEEKRKFEEEKRKFEEEKKLFPQKVVVVDDEKETKPSLFESSIETADKHVNLFEKIINIPVRGEKFGKTISENVDVILKKLKDSKAAKRITKGITSSATAGVIIFKEEIKEFTGISVKDSAGGSNSGESNGVLNEGNGKVDNKARNGGRGAASTGVDPAASTGVDPAASTGVDPAASTGVDPAASTGVDPAASTGVDPAASTVVDPAASTVVDPAALTVVAPAASTVVAPAASTVVAPAASTVVAPAAPTVVAPAAPTGVAPAAPTGVAPAASTSDDSAPATGGVTGALVKVE